MDVDQEQQKRLDTHRQHLAVLLEQQATFGVASTPPAVVLGIAEARAEIKRIKAYLRAHGIPVTDHLNDDPPPVAALPRPVAVPGSSGGDHVGGDKTTVGTIIGSTDIAIGPRATVDKRSGFFIGRSRIALLIIGVLVLLFLIIGMIVAGASVSGFKQTLQGVGILPTNTPTAVPPTATPTAEPLAFAPEQQGETLLVIASFRYTEGNRNTAIHEEIQQAIREVLKTTAVPNLRIEIAPEIIAAADRAEAEQLGNHYNASIVIWGEDTGTRVTVNFLNRREPTNASAEVSINETLRTQIARPEAYASFVTHDLPQQMTFLALFAVGQSASVRKDYPIATQIIRRAVETVQDSLPLADANLRQGVARASFYLGWLYQVPGHDTQRTLEAYTQAITLDPNYAYAYNNRGNAYAAQQQLDKALADYTQAITLDPNYANAYYNRGNAYAAQQQLDEALADYTQAITLDPTDAHAYNNRGIVYRTQQQLDKAVADYTQAITLDPKLALAYYNRGLVYAAQQQWGEALADYMQAITLDPTHANAYYNRGLLYQERNERDAAIADFRQARNLFTDPGKRQNATEHLQALGAE